MKSGKFRMWTLNPKNPNSLKINYYPNWEK